MYMGVFVMLVEAHTLAFVVNRLLIPALQCKACTWTSLTNSAYFNIKDSAKKDNLCTASVCLENILMQEFERSDQGYKPVQS